LHHTSPRSACGPCSSTLLDRTMTPLASALNCSPSRISASRLAGLLRHFGRRLSPGSLPTNASNRISSRIFASRLAGILSHFVFAPRPEGKSCRQTQPTVPPQEFLPAGWQAFKPLRPCPSPGSRAPPANALNRTPSRISASRLARLLSHFVRRPLHGWRRPPAYARRTGPFKRGLRCRSRSISPANDSASGPLPQCSEVRLEVDPLTAPTPSPAPAAPTLLRQRLRLLRPPPGQPALQRQSLFC